MITCIIDLDDTICHTTRDLRGSRANLPRLTLVSGAREFLQRLGHRSILLSAGDEHVQRRKLAHLNIGYFFRQVILVPEGASKDAQAAAERAYAEKYNAIGSIVREAGQSSKIVVVGDRLDAEVAIGNRLGCRTVRMRLPEGKYARVPPRAPEEIPNYAVADYWQLAELIPILQATANSSPAR